MYKLQKDCAPLTIQISEPINHGFLLFLVCAFDSLLTWYCGRWIYRNDGLQAFVENFLKDHFLPAMFVDYRKCVQQAISSKNYFRILKRALGYVIFKRCNNTILMNYNANWLCLLCLINSHISNIWHWSIMDWAFKYLVLVIGPVGTDSFLSELT